MLVRFWRLSILTAWTEHWQYWIGKEWDDEKVQAISSFSGRSFHVSVFRFSENGEDIQVLRYEPGQKYEPHYDYFADKVNIARGGHRVATVLMYLTDVAKGGETVFPRAEVSWSIYLLHSIEWTLSPLYRLMLLEFLCDFSVIWVSESFLSSLVNENRILLPIRYSSIDTSWLPLDYSVSDMRLSLFFLVWYHIWISKNFGFHIVFQPVVCNRKHGMLKGC